MARVLALLGGAAGLLLVPGQAFAQDATWTGATSGDWNTASNWSIGAAPTGVATFGASARTSITFASNVSIGTLAFSAGAPVYSLDTSPSYTLLITGSGIVNDFTSVQITNSGGGGTAFRNLSTAGNASISNLIGISSASGNTYFNDASTAGNSRITNTGDTNTGNLSITYFYGMSTSGNSTITNNNKGATFFNDTSTGGQARFINNAGGLFDISYLSSTGMTAGSIEGAGTFWLGSKTLTVGSNNLSTEVSGAILDGGNNAGSTRASLVKVGTGTLILSVVRSIETDGGMNYRSDRLI